MIEIFVLIAGVVLLVKGRIQATRTTEVSGRAGRVLGFVLVAPAVINFLSGFFGLFTEEVVTTISYVEYATVIVALVVVLVFYRRPIGSI